MTSTDLHAGAPKPPRAADLSAAIRTLRIAAACCATLTALYVGAASDGSSSTLVLANSSLPGVLAALCVVCAFLTVRRCHLLMLTPLPWFFLACAAYFGVGPLIYHAANEETIAFTHAFFYVDEASLLRTNLLNAVAIGLICFSSAIVIARWRQAVAQPVPASRAQLLRLVLFFVIIGLPVKYFLTLPSQFLILSFTVPGSVQQLAMFSSLALFTLSFLYARGEIKFGFWTLALVISELAVSLVTFSKMESLITILMIFLGWYIARPRLRYFITVGVVGIVFYLAMAPFVLRMREQLADVPTETQGFEARVALLSAYVFGSGQSDTSIAGTSDQVQLWWFRLNYANAQAFAMNEYDNARPGDTFGNALLSFVPRALWPDKPEISTGHEFNEMITGNDQSSSAPGIFAEAYWNGGWLLVLITCVYVGALFGVFTRLTVNAIERLDFRWLPCAFVGIYIGGRPDDLFVLTYVTMIGLTIGYYLFISRVVFRHWDTPNASDGAIPVADPPTLPSMS